MAHKTKINGTAYEISGGKTRVNGTGYSIAGGKTKVNGTAYGISFVNGVPISTLAVGSTVKIKVNGSSKDFIIIHQGIPNTSIYDASCNGTWLMMKDVYEMRQWHSSNSNSYKASTIHAYLNGTFLNLVDSSVRSAIKTVKIPYVNGTGSGGSVASGSNGLSAKIFLLSSYEVGFSFSDSRYTPYEEGVKLNYFIAGKSTDAKNRRNGKYNGTNALWWLRSPYTKGINSAWNVCPNVGYTSYDCTRENGIRPAFVLPSETLVDKNSNVRV